MKLTELEPRWLGGSAADGDDRRRLGISFVCPLHRDDGDRLGVFFANPVDGGPPHVDTWIDPATKIVKHNYLWQRTGETFDDLTLTPSVDASEHGCWHGYITNGEIR